MNYCKLKNNSIFGKMMEDVRNRIDNHLLTRWDSVERLTSSPLFIDVDLFSDSVVGVYMFKHKLYWISQFRSDKQYWFTVN